MSDTNPNQPNALPVPESTSPARSPEAGFIPFPPSEAATPARSRQASQDGSNDGPAGDDTAPSAGSSSAPTTRPTSPVAEGGDAEATRGMCPEPADEGRHAGTARTDLTYLTEVMAIASAGSSQPVEAPSTGAPAYQVDAITGRPTELRPGQAPREFASRAVVEDLRRHDQQAVTVNASRAPSSPPALPTTAPRSPPPPPHVAAPSRSPVRGSAAWALGQAHAQRLAESSSASATTRLRPPTALSPRHLASPASSAYASLSSPSALGGTRLPAPRARPPHHQPVPTRAHASSSSALTPFLPPPPQSAAAGQAIITTPLADPPLDQFPLLPPSSSPNEGSAQFFADWAQRKRGRRMASDASEEGSGAAAANREDDDDEDDEDDEGGEDDGADEYGYRRSHAFGLAKSARRGGQGSGRR